MPICVTVYFFPSQEQYFKSLTTLLTYSLRIVFFQVLTEKTRTSELDFIPIQLQHLLQTIINT